MEEESLWDNYALDQRDKKLENICNKVDGKWTKEGCDTDGGDTPKADRFYELVDKEPGATIQDGEYGVIPFQTPEPEDDKVKQEDSPPVIEDWGNTVETTDTDDELPEVPEDMNYVAPSVTVEGNDEEQNEELDEQQEEEEEPEEEEPEEEEEEEDSDEESDDGGEEESSEE